MSVKALWFREDTTDLAPNVAKKLTWAFLCRLDEMRVSVEVPEIGESAIVRVNGDIVDEMDKTQSLYELQIHGVYIEIIQQQQQFWMRMNGEDFDDYYNKLQFKVRTTENTPKAAQGRVFHQGGIRLKRNAPEAAPEHEEPIKVISRIKSQAIANKLCRRVPELPNNGLSPSKLGRHEPGTPTNTENI